MVIRYGEALWPGTSPRPGESKNVDDQPPAYSRGGIEVGSPATSLSRVRVE